jgi:hypothetical protein
MTIAAAGPETVQSPPSQPWHRVWTDAFRNPNEAGYQALLADSNATGGRGLRWLLISNAIVYGIVVAIMAGFLLVFGLAAFTSRSNDTSPGLMLLIFAGVLLIEYVLMVGFALIGNVFTSGIPHLIAKLLGGSGSFSKVIYLYAAINSPFLLVYITVGMLPFVNMLLLPAVFYIKYLEILAIKTVHRLTWMRAAIAVLTPVIVGIIIYSIFIILYFLLFFGLFASQIQHIFPNLIQNYSI